MNASEEDGDVFQFLIDYPEAQYRSGNRDRFEKDFHGELLAINDLKCAMTKSLRKTHGFVYKETGDVTESDRSRFKEWAQNQSVACEFELGLLEPCAVADFTRDFNGDTFAIDG
jgi:hypothetical protein